MVSCTDWAVPGAADHPDVNATGSAPILVVGNTGDPATPYEGARKMVGALGAGVGVELTYKGQGHGAYDSGNRCVLQGGERLSAEREGTGGRDRLLLGKRRSKGYPQADTASA